MPAFACSEEPISTTVVPRNRSSVAVNDLNSKLCSFIHDFIHVKVKGTAVTQWLRCCATNRKVAGSIPDGVIRIFH